MTSPEERIATLLDRWLESLELHREYAQLDDDAYWAARDWVAHERPTVWVIDLARDKTLELKRLYEARGRLDGEQVAAAIELAVLLANLVGSQNVQRFVPLIAPDTSDTSPRETGIEPATDSTSDTRRMRVPASSAAGKRSDDAATERHAAAPPLQEPTAAPAAEAGDRPDASRSATAPSASTKSRGQHHAHARTAARVASRKGADGGAASSPGKRASAGNPPSKAEKMVIADAVRLLKWGRAWHELAEAIARMSGRPPHTEVRAILRDRREEIEIQASAASG